MPDPLLSSGRGPVLHRGQVMLCHPFASFGLSIGGRVDLADLHFEGFEIAMNLQEFLQLLS